jgi:putative transposase
MPTGLKRFQQTKLFHLITFSCYKRQPLLRTPEAKDTVARFLEQTRRQQGLLIAAYVLMPEHVHLLTNEPAVDTLATFLQIFKQLTARELKSPDQKQFWQRRYYDFNVSSQEKFVEKLRYIHRNPVVRGLVSKPEDYRWSSFNHYATGQIGAVEIESEWTARRRGSALPTPWIVLPTLRRVAHPRLSSNAGWRVAPPLHQPQNLGFPIPRAFAKGGM